MICPRCGRQVDKVVDYCPVCGAGMGVQRGAEGVADAPETEVLLEGYRDFQDTVVEQATQFDPMAFSTQSIQTGEIAPSVDGRTTPIGQVAPSPAPSAGEDGAYRTWKLDEGVAPEGGKARSHSDPASTVSGGSPAYGGTPGSSSPKSDPRAGSSSGAAIGANGARKVSVLPAPAGLGVGAEGQSRPLMIALAALAVVAVGALAFLLVALLAPPGGSSALQNAHGADESPSAAAVVPVASDGEESNGEKDATAELLDEEYEALDNADDYTSSPTGGTLGNKRASENQMTEGQAYQLLSSYLAKAGEFDKSISKCATDFNSTYVVESKKDRTAKSETVTKLKSQVGSAWEALKDIELPVLSLNQTAWEDLCECYECLWNRLDSLEKAWKISLSYDKPEKHKDEILAPVKADQGADGQNKYKTRFDKLYASIKLEKS